jgi:hypothetical protein
MISPPGNTHHCVRHITRAGEKDLDAVSHDLVVLAVNFLRGKQGLAFSVSPSFQLRVITQKTIQCAITERFLGCICGTDCGASSTGAMNLVQGINTG